MARPGVEHQTEIYSQLVAARLRELRNSAGLSIDEFLEKCLYHGVEINKTTAYSYERGRTRGGADLPSDHYPLIALVYGYQTPTGWLPDLWPSG